MIKQIGDAFMLVFAEPADAITFGLAIKDAAGVEPKFPALHIGANPGDAEYAPLPPRRLKGLPDPVRLVRVRRRGAQRAEREVDPVCGMLLQPGDVHSRRTWQQREPAI